MKGIYWKCEMCGKKSFDVFPSSWIHLPHLTIQVGKGLFIDWDRVTYENKKDYSQFRDLTFCSLYCYLEWLKKTFPTKNPSERV